MNERIKELYNQADKFAKENRTQTISGPGNNYFELFHEKFAELIVKECSGICDNIQEQHTKEFGDYIGDTYAAICRDAINQHFGVKE